MRAIIRRFDGLLRRASAVFEFCDEADCLLRLQIARAPHDLHLSDGTGVRAGDPVLMLHLWNEHVPPIGPAGPDLAWAVSVRRMLVHSLRAAARWLANEPGLTNVRAVGGVTVLVTPGSAGGDLRLMRRLGFDVLPYRGLLGRFGEFWENLYAWGLMWAFNAISLRRRQLFRLHRAEVWISARMFLERYNISTDANGGKNVHDTNCCD